MNVVILQSMVRLLICLLAIAAVTRAGEGTTPKAKPSEYPAHLATPEFALAADYTVRTVIAPARTVFLKDYLVVEVALYPVIGKQLLASASRFRLRLNGSKGALYPQTAGMVAASLRHPSWERDRELVVQAGPVILGRAPASSRFPGDPEASSRAPLPRPAPADPVKQRDEAISDEEIITDVSLRESTVTLPVSGYLYFAWKGKPEKLRKVELLFESQPESNPVALRLR